MKYKCCIILCVLALLISGCAQRGTPAVNDLLDAFLIVKTNVPFAMNANTHQFDRAECVEQDAYDRKLVRYTTYCSSIHHDIELYLICQGTDEYYTYYYMDACYIARDIRKASFPEHAIKELKERNDWNKPLEKAKLKSISLSTPRKYVCYEEVASELLRAYLELDNDVYSSNVQAMEMLDGNSQLFYGYTFPRDNTESNNRFFLFVCTDDPRQPIAACQEIEFSFELQDTIAQFRSAWKRVA